jgi:hypothetical protein
VLGVPSQESEQSCLCVLGVPSQESEQSCLCVLGVPSQESEQSCLCGALIIFLTCLKLKGETDTQQNGKQNIYQTVLTIPNIKIIQSGQIDTPNTQKTNYLLTIESRHLVLS